MTMYINCPRGQENIKTKFIIRKQNSLLELKFAEDERCCTIHLQ